jgi:hypothetical protein
VDIFRVHMKGKNELLCFFERCDNSEASEEIDLKITWMEIFRAKGITDNIKTTLF